VKGANHELIGHGCFDSLAGHGELGHVLGAIAAAVSTYRVVLVSTPGKLKVLVLLSASTCERCPENDSRAIVGSPCRREGVVHLGGADELLSIDMAGKRHG
jgi:hypothetical protein